VAAVEISGKSAELAGLKSELDLLRHRLAELEPRFESHSMDLLRCVLANVPDFIAMLAPDGTMLFLNRVREGASLDAVLGKSVYDYTAPGQVAEYRACVDRVVRTGRRERIEQDARLSDGTTAWFETRLEPIRDGERVIALIAIATDVSPRKRAAKALRESEVKLRVAVDAAGIGLWSWDIRSDEVVWEDALCALFALPVGTAPTGRDGYVAMVHPEDRTRAAEAIGRGVTAGAWDDEHPSFDPTAPSDGCSSKGACCVMPTATSCSARSST
jgi:PAS domain S-box-containing protein